MDARESKRAEEEASERELPAGELDGLRPGFLRTFAAFDIALPDDTVRARRDGSLQVGTGFALYRWGGPRGDFVEAYARHRMTNARHVRILDSGAAENLAEASDPFIPRSMWQLYRDTDPDAG